MPRPTKLDLEMLPVIEEEAAAGTPEKYIAALIGINRMTWINWKKKAAEAERRQAEEGKAPTKNQKLYIEFMAALRKGYSQRVKKSLRTVLDSDNPKDHLAFLERFDPQNFGTAVRIDMDDLYNQLKKEYGGDKAEAVVEILMREDSNE